MHSEMAKVLGNAMGTFKSVDNSHAKGFIGTTLRFRVDIDVSKPLRRMIQIAGPEGHEIQIGLAYELLPNFCYLWFHRPLSEGLQ